MSYIILSGPAVASVLATKMRVFSCIETEQFTQLASIEVDPKAKVNTLRLFNGYSDPKYLGHILTFVTQIAKQYKGQEIIATDTDAVMLTTSLNTFMNSSNEEIVKAWTALNFTVEAEAPNLISNNQPTNKIRFVGKNLVGLKHIVSASSVKFTITAT